MNTALLLLEFQNDYFQNGRTPLEKSLEASTKALGVLNAYRQKKCPIVHIQHISTHPDANSLLPCTRGADFHENVHPQKGEMIVKKHYPNSFKDTNLLNYLVKNRINHLVICGMTTQLAIDATVRAAYDLGFTCTVLEDACAARQVEFHQTSVSAFNVHYAFLGALNPIYATILDCEHFLQHFNARSREHLVDEVSA